jgi:hypothetical protein
MRYRPDQTLRRNPAKLARVVRRLTEQLDKRDDSAILVAMTNAEINQMTDLDWARKSLERAERNGYTALAAELREEIADLEEQQS